MIEPLVNFANANALLIWAFLWLCIGIPIAIIVFNRNPVQGPIGDEGIIYLAIFCTVATFWPAALIFYIVNWLTQTNPHPLKQKNLKDFKKDS